MEAENMRPRCKRSCISARGPLRLNCVCYKDSKSVEDTVVLTPEVSEALRAAYAHCEEADLLFCAPYVLLAILTVPESQAVQCFDSIRPRPARTSQSLSGTSGTERKLRAFLAIQLEWEPRSP